MENIQKGPCVLDDDYGPLPVGRWTISHNKCNGCGDCIDNCLRDLLKFEKEKVVITNETACNQCGDCVRACIFRAIVLT